MLYWILTQKAKSPELDAKQCEVSLKKAHSAVNRAMHLLAIELSIGQSTLKLMVTNNVAEHKTFASIQAEVARGELRVISMQDYESNNPSQLDQESA